MNPLSLLALLAGIVVVVMLLLMLSMCIIAKRRDSDMHRILANEPNPFKKGEPGSPVGEKRGGEDTAAPLSFLSDGNLSGLTLH